MRNIENRKKDIKRNHHHHRQRERKKESIRRRRSSRALVFLVAKTRGRVRTSIDDLSPLLGYFCPPPQKAIYKRTLLAGHNVQLYAGKGVCCAYTVHKLSKGLFIDNAGALD